MTETEQIIALAKDQGWTDIHLCRLNCDLQEELIGIPPDVEKRGPGIDKTKYYPLDDYNDRNAMQRLVEKLDESKRGVFIRCLLYLVVVNKPIFPDYWWLITATTAQIGESYLRANGLWKE